MTDQTQEAGKALKSLLGHFAAIFHELQQLQNKPVSSEAQTDFIRGITAIASDARKNLDDFTSIMKPVNTENRKVPLAEIKADAIAILKDTAINSPDEATRRKAVEYLAGKVIRSSAQKPTAEPTDLKTFVNRLHGKSVQDEELDAFREKLEKQALADIVADYNDGRYEDAAGALQHLNRLLPKS